MLAAHLNGLGCDPLPGEVTNDAIVLKEQVITSWYIGQQVAQMPATPTQSLNQAKAYCWSEDCAHLQGVQTQESVRFQQLTAFPLHPGAPPGLSTHQSMLLRQQSR